MLHESGRFRASSIHFAMIGQRKHSVLPEPVPVDTNKSFPCAKFSKGFRNIMGREEFLKIFTQDTYATRIPHFGMYTGFIPSVIFS